MATIDEIETKVQHLTSGIGNLAAGFDKAFPSSDKSGIGEKTFKGQYALFLEGMRNFCTFAKEQKVEGKALYFSCETEAKRQIILYFTGSILSQSEEYKNARESFAEEDEKWIAYGFYAGAMLLRHREINDEAIGYIKNIFFDPRTSIKEFDELESASRNNAFSILKLARDAQLDGGFFR